MALARYHSFESCGTTDGPGIRFILFLQGCLMRCLYCHNRDTWDVHGGKTIDVDTLMQEVLSYQHYMRASGGGVTASGGEPLLQPEFLNEWFRACHKHNIHTCLDTNGFVKHYTKTLDDLMEVTDLIMLDLKQLDKDTHRMLIGVKNDKTLRFLDYIQEHNKKIWIRHVLVPGYTDSKEHLEALAEQLKKIKNLERFELLPYHELGVHKWNTLGETYKLADVKAPTKARMQELIQFFKDRGIENTH